MTHQGIHQYRRDIEKCTIRVKITYAPGSSIQTAHFSRLREQGHEVLSLDRAMHQDIRELHIGFLNMMPDAALQATERQFIRLVGGCNRIAQFFVYPFSLPGLPRGEETLEYIERYYSNFEDLQESGLDALIITGANVVNPSLESEPFWDPLMEVISWAQEMSPQPCAPAWPPTPCSSTFTASTVSPFRKSAGVFTVTGSPPDIPCYGKSTPGSTYRIPVITTFPGQQLEEAGSRCWWKAKRAACTWRSARTSSGSFISRDIPNTTPTAC